MLFNFKEESTGITIFASLALVPSGPLMGAYRYSSDPFSVFMLRKLPTSSTFSLIPIRSRFPRLYSHIVRLGLSGTIILLHCLMYLSVSLSPGVSRGEKR